MNFSISLKSHFKTMTIFSLLLLISCSSEKSVKKPSFDHKSNLNGDDNTQKKKDTKKVDKKGDDDDDDDKGSSKKKSSSKRPKTADEIALKRAKDSECILFNTRDEYAFGARPKDYGELSTNINHYPPAKYPMPPHLTWPEGYWEDDAFIFTASVDILISYNTHDVPYAARWKSVLPGDPEDNQYERVFYEIKIDDADSAGCENNINYTKVE